MRKSSFFYLALVYIGFIKGFLATTANWNGRYCNSGTNRSSITTDGRNRNSCCCVVVVVAVVGVAVAGIVVVGVT